MEKRTVEAGRRTPGDAERLCDKIKARLPLGGVGGGEVGVRLEDNKTQISTF